MTEHFTQIIGAEEAVRIVCQKLDRFAAHNKLPPRMRAANVRRVGDVEVWFSPDEPGVARFHVVTHDNCDVDVKVDFAELSSDYLDEMVAGVKQELNKHRAGRGHNRAMN